jgi:hypothetical protein
MLRAEEAQARFDYIRSRAAEVGEKDRAKREDLARKLEVRQVRPLSIGAWCTCSNGGGATSLE